MTASLEMLRGGLALVLLGVLAFWTWRRARGVGTDPSIALATGDGVGRVSFLASGIAAVGIVAIILVFLLAPEIVSAPALGLVLVAIVVSHLYLEIMEARS